MSAASKAKLLASQGLNNSEIFAELELTAPALEALLRKDPQFVFQLVQGRSKYLEPLIAKLVDLALDPDSPKTNYAALEAAISRADKSNSTIMLAQEMVLLKGLAPTGIGPAPAASTVTELLRRTS